MPRVLVSRYVTVLLAVSAATCALAEPRTNLLTNVGLLGITLTNLGYFGNAFSNRNQPSGEYPLYSNVEHIYRGGIWVGARASDGTVHVSTGAQDANGLQEGDDIREFEDFYDTDNAGNPENFVRIWSNSQNADNYNPAALATQHFELFFDDYTQVESGNHTPLGVKVRLRALAWGNPFADDFVIMDYTLVNVSSGELRDVYLGLWLDTSVGNTEYKTPYDSQATNRWDYWDDYNGAFGPVGVVEPSATVEDDPNIWMAYEHDADGDEGLATSWIGYRLLGTNLAPATGDTVPPVSFNMWRFRGVPERDDEYENPDEPGVMLPGKYQIMKNHNFDVGDKPENNFAAQSNWVSMMSTGPFTTWAPGDTLTITFAIVAAPDSLGLLSNSKVAQVAYDDGFTIPSGPPSPRITFATDNNSVIISWAAGDSLDTQGQVLPTDSPLRSPEHHISLITGREDFQGYRIYRFQGTSLSGNPFETATMVAQFDRIDGIGFDTGLPPRGEDGRRRFTDTGLLDGFPYWYAVTTFSAPDIEDGLPEFESGFNENADLVFPGPGAAGSGATGGVGVYPNPYRAASLFDSRATGGVAETGRKLWFTGLPARSRIQVFTLAGDLIKTLEHDDPNSGQEAWDLISEPVRAIASGLYIYAVTDLDTGDVQRGKLVIIK
ncbi:MAG: hypothetical protein IPI48_14845 [bacterium]|nr:hypothetical protein [bacterium]